MLIVDVGMFGGSGYPKPKKAGHFISGSVLDTYIEISQEPPTLNIVREVKDINIRPQIRYPKCT